MFFKTQQLLCEVTRNELSVSKQTQSEHVHSYAAMRHGEYSS